MDIALFLIMISSGSLLGVSVFGRRFEEGLPVTCGGLILWLYGFGLCGQLPMGVYTACALAALMCVFSLLWAVWKKQIGEFLAGVCTPGAIFFFAAVALCGYCVSGKLFDAVEELSHYGDAVRAMIMVDGLNLAENSQAIFRADLPGLYLLQYLLQKLYVLKTAETFCEWRTYLPAAVLTIAFVAPSLRGLTLRQAGYALPVCAALLIAPLLIGQNVYLVLSPLPVLCVVMASGIMSLRECGQGNGMAVLRVVACCVVLSLLHESGIAFALVLAIAAILALQYAGKDIRKNLLTCAALAGAAVLPGLSWALAAGCSVLPEPLSALT